MKSTIGVTIDKKLIQIARKTKIMKKERKEPFVAFRAGYVSGSELLLLLNILHTPTLTQRILLLENR